MRLFTEGHSVDIFFETVEAEFNVKIMHIPVDTGDSWYFMRQDGTTLSVMNYAKMVRVL